MQVLDNNDNDTYVNGQVGSIYKQSIPLVMASVPTGEWNAYDIIFHTPEFDSDGYKTKSGTITVLHNGILIQDNFELKGTTEYIGWPKNTAHGKAPILLQDHGLPNVFVTDGACMTSSGTQNPSITYMALTARAVDFAHKQMQKGKL